MSIVLIAIRDLQCFAAQCNVADPLVSLSSLAGLAAIELTSFLPVNEHYPGAQEVGRLYLASRCGFEALSADPSRLYNDEFWRNLRLGNYLVFELRIFWSDGLDIEKMLASGTRSILFLGDVSL